MALNRESALNGLAEELDRHTNAPSPVRFEGMTRRITELAASPSGYTLQEQQLLERLMVACSTTEPVWGLLLGMCLWNSGRQTPHDFQNIWDCSRFAGIGSRFSPKDAEAHLAEVATGYGGQRLTPDNWAPFIIRGNALRQLHRYAEAESAYLHGLDVCPDNPLLKFRLVDLWLLTYQLDRAKQMLACLRPRFGYALEMLFQIPVSSELAVSNSQLPSLDPGECDYVWLVAADPVYVERYAQGWARSVADTLGEVASRKLLRQPLLHVHVLHPTGSAQTNAGTDGNLAACLSTIATLLPIKATQRRLDLCQATSNQRKAVFASERFLFLAEMLSKYQRPILVTDIDVECIRDPSSLFDKMGGADIGHTRFTVVRDAWDKYPATALLFMPTEAAIGFCRHLAAMITVLIQQHPQPWFVDQVALYRMIEEGRSDAKLVLLESVLTDSDSPLAYFRTLHGSWSE